MLHSIQNKNAGEAFGELLQGLYDKRMHLPESARELFALKKKYAPTLRSSIFKQAYEEKWPATADRPTLQKVLNGNATFDEVSNAVRKNRKLSNQLAALGQLSKIWSADLPLIGANVAWSQNPIDLMSGAIPPLKHWHPQVNHLMNQLPDQPDSVVKLFEGLKDNTARLPQRWGAPRASSGGYLSALRGNTFTQWASRTSYSSIIGNLAGAIVHFDSKTLQVAIGGMNINIPVRTEGGRIVDVLLQGNQETQGAMPG